MPSAARLLIRSRMSRMPPGSSPFVGSSSTSSLGFAEQRRRQAEPLPHPLRVAADLVACPALKPDRLEHGADPAGGVPAVEGGEQLEVRAAGQIRVEVGRLDEAADTVERLRKLPLRVATEDPDLALVRAQQSEQHAHRGRLAGPVRAEEAVDVALVDAQIDVVHRTDVPVRLDEPAGLHRHHVPNATRLR